jgi:hypothetical protein
MLFVLSASRTVTTEKPISRDTYIKILLFGGHLASVEILMYFVRERYIQYEINHHTIVFCTFTDLEINKK